MTTIVFLSVLLAALLHASWNALVKGGLDKHASMTAVAVGHVPLVLLIAPFVPFPEPAAWPYLALSIVLHLGYQLFLIAAYRIGDLTQVYPLARGSAPMIVAVISVGLLGVTLQRDELLAIGLIASGIVSLALVRRSDNLARNPRAVAAALATGGFIASYSLVDGTGARLAGSALGYWTWAALGDTILLCTWTLVVKPKLLYRLAHDRRLLLSGLAGGSASFIAYGLVVWAFTQAPIALVAGLRETSIVFALLFGVAFLRERLDLAKVASTAITLSGAIMLRFVRN